MPRLVLITGPAGAGKSTISQQLAASRDEPTALIDHDQVRRFVRSGYRPAGPDPEAQHQWNLAKQVCQTAAEIYLAGCLNVIIDAAAPGLWRNWTKRLDTPLQAVVLLPSLETIISRNAQRAPPKRLSPDAIVLSYEIVAGREFENAAVIDNSDLTVPETLALVEQQLDWPSPNPRGGRADSR